MRQSMLRQATEYAKRHYRKKRWQKVVTVLAAVVVFCTTYALILPAITMEKDCQIPEHTHTEACYTKETSTIEKMVPVCTAENPHHHTASCYNDNAEAVCGYADFVIHQHDASCYDADGNLLCPLPEIKSHTHDASCWTEVRSTHEHTDACCEWEQGDLVCGQEERDGHIHGESCYTTASSLTCQIPESSGHQHDASCCAEDGELVCGLAEGEGSHSHTEDCFKVTKTLACEIPEDSGHRHCADCYEKVQGKLICTEQAETTALELTCGKAEIIPHKHTDECYDENGTLICGKTQILEHKHTDACFKTVEEPVETEVLNCGMEEHTHTDECYASANSLHLMGVATLEDSGDDDAAANDGERAPFASYVTGVKYEDATYNPATDQVEVSFELTFAIGNAAMHPGSTEQHNFVYALPKGVTIPDTMLGKTYTGRDTSGAEGFTYSFVKNDNGTYSILIDFIHDYVKDKDNFEGYINFSAYAGATNDEESEYKYTFGDSYEVTIKPEEIKHPEGESMHYNIAVEKSASSFNYDENKITYTVTVDSTKGTPNPLNLTDVLKLNGLSVDHVQLGSVVVEDRWDQWNMVQGSATTIENASLAYDGATSQITMSLPGLGTGSEGNGQRYTITYDVYLNEPAAGSQYDVGNKATVSGNDTEKGEIIKDSDETTTTVNKDLDLKKVGTYNKDTNTITWSITVNGNRNNIAGSTLTDDMFASIKNTVKFDPSDGIAWGTGEAENTLVFSAVDGNVNKNSYTITYTTPLPEGLTFTDGVAVVDNKATVTPPSGDKKETEATVTIDKTVDIGKKGEYDKSQNKIKWVITVNQNGNPLKDTVLTDTMFDQVPAYSITVSPGTEGLSITENADGTIEKITFNESAGSQTYTITYYTTVPDPQESEESVTVKNESTVTPPDLPPKTDEETVIVNKAVDLSKTGSYDKISDTITWTITVNQNGNDLTGKVLTDGMFEQFTDKSQITISPKDSGYEWDGDNLKFTAVENGVNNQTYTITYTTKSGVDINGKDTVSNTVGLDGKETTTDVSVDRTITFDKQDGSYNAHDKCIWWTIELNTNNQNIYNFVLTDEMFADMVEGSLEVKVNGSWDAKDETAGAYKVYKDEDGKVTSIVFDTVGTTGGNTNHYTIKYATPAEPKWDSYTVTNTATIDPPGDTPPIEDPGEATVPGEGSVVKKCESGILGENGLLELTWKMEVKVPSTGLPAGTTITDTLKDGQWMTRGQIVEWASVLNAKDVQGNYVGGTGLNYWWPAGKTYDIVFTADDGTTCTYADIVSGTNGAFDKKFVGFTLKFLSEIAADPYGGNIIWFDYQSYANVSSVTDSQKYHNTISITPPGGTSKDSTASYDYKKAGVYKTDGNGNKESTPFTTTDGVLTWKVRVRTSKDCDKVTVVDTLPQGVTLTGIKFGNTELTISNGTQISCNPIWFGNNLLHIDGSITEKDTGDEIELVLSSKNYDGSVDVQIPYRSEFDIYYTCKINQGVLNGMNAEQATSFTNTVTAWEDETELPSDSHTQEVKYDSSSTTVQVVDKSGEWVNDSRLLDYSVELNPKGTDLVEGADTLTLTDMLQFSTYPTSPKDLIDAALLPGSVKLFTAHRGDDGKLVKDEEIKNWTWKVETKVDDQSWQVLHQSIITATVPDSTPMIFEYAYSVWLPEGSTTDQEQYNPPKVSNTVELKGDSDFFDKEESKIEWKESHTEAGIKYDQTLILYKVEEGNYGKTLPGAVFALYDASKNQIGTYTTDSNGSFVIKWDEEGKTFEYNKLYYLVESEAPEGYLMPDDPEEYCFYFSKTGDGYTPLDPGSIPQGAVDLSVSAYPIYCENEKSTTSITVDKKWLSSGGDDITSSKGGSVTFNLYQKSSTTPPGESGGSGGGISSGGNVTVSINLGKYGPDGEIHNGTYTCKSGSTVEFDVASWGTPVLKFGSDFWNSTDVIEPVSQSGSQPTFFHYRFTVTESVVVTGKTDDNNLQTITVSITEPADSKPDPSPETPEDYLVGSYTIGPNTDAHGWRLTIDNLPKQGTDTDGNTVYYTYYIVENAGNYSTEYNNNGGIASGTITVTNTESDTPGYVMPETGGAGTQLYTAGGALLTAAAGILLYIQNKRRKEGTASS